MLLLLAALACRDEGDEPETPAEGDADTDTDTDADTDVYEDVAIASIQEGLLEQGSLVRVSDVVVMGVAPSGHGLFVQESDRAYGGIWVYTQGGGFVHSVGEVVTVTGAYEEYDAEGEWPDSLSEIDASSGDVAVTDTQEPFAAIALDDPDADLEPYEGLLVRVEGLTVQDGDLPFGEWTASGWTIDDKLYEADARYYPGDTVASVTGVLDYSYGAYKLQPRGADDIVGHSSAVLGVGQLSPGQLLLTELMIDPGAECVDADDEYVEIYNDSAFTVDLDGLVVGYGADDATVGRALVAPHSHALLVRQSPSPCYGHAGHAELHLALDQVPGVVSLRSPGGTQLDSVDASDWTVTSGVAWGFDGQTWCEQTSPLRSDFGTPGAPNDPCQ